MKGSLIKNTINQLNGIVTTWTGLVGVWHVLWSNVKLQECDLNDPIFEIIQFNWD